MGKIDNLTDPSQEVRRLWAAIRKLQTATPLASASVERGRLRFYAGSELLIEDGNFSVAGTATVTGVLGGSGSFTWTGPVTLTGATTVSGSLTVSGATSLASTLTMGTGAKIVAAGMTIARLASGIGGITWGTTFPSLYSDGSNVAIGAGTNQYVSVGTGGPAMVNGARAFSIDATSHQMVAAATSGSAANVYVDPTTGRMYRSTSSLRYKKNVRTYTPDPRLLRKVRTVLFDDDTGTNRTDIPGVIAEVVAKNGGEHLVERDEIGRVESVAYDRLAIERTAILAAENDEIRAELIGLREQIAGLAALVKSSQ